MTTLDRLHAAIHRVMTEPRGARWTRAGETLHAAWWRQDAEVPALKYADGTLRYNPGFVARHPQLTEALVLVVEKGSVP